MYEAVAMAGSTQTALLTPALKPPAAGTGGMGVGEARPSQPNSRRLNDDSSVHGGMLMAMLTRAGSLLSLGNVLNDGSPEHADAADPPKSSAQPADPAPTRFHSRPLSFLPGASNRSSTSEGTGNNRQGHVHQRMVLPTSSWFNEWRSQ